MLVFHLIQAILLKKAVSPLLQISTRATAICSEDGISLKISPPSVSGMVMVLLHINSSSFHRFRCNSNCIESLDLSFLNSLLSTTNNDLESLIVSANYSHDTTLIYFNFFTNTHHNAQFESDQTRLLLYYEPRTPGNPYNYLGIHESEYEYQVILGIPSKEFRQILRYIREFATLIVDVIVTNAEVLTFRSGSEDLILTKEAGCIVWGVDSSNQVTFRMTLFNINSFIEALENSAFVWMFQSPDFPGMLNCPVGHLGNIKYYFDKRYDLRIH